MAVQTYIIRDDDGNEVGREPVARRVTFEASDCIQFVQEIGDVPFPISDDRQPVEFKVLQPSQTAQMQPALLNSCTQGAAQSISGPAPQRRGHDSRIPGPSRTTYFEQVNTMSPEALAAPLDSPYRPIAGLYRIEDHTTARDQQYGDNKVLVLIKHTISSLLALARGLNQHAIDATSDDVREALFKSRPYAYQVGAERQAEHLALRGGAAVSGPQR